MSNAIMVTDNGGHYSMIGAATAEDWSEVQAIADEVSKIEDLTGWGEYSAAYKVNVGGVDVVYFVAE